MASDTSPTVAVSAAVPVPLTVTSPSCLTVITSSLLLVHISALSVSAGSTIAAAINVVPTGIAVSSISISTVVISLTALLSASASCGLRFFCVRVIPTVFSLLLLCSDITPAVIAAAMRTKTAIPAIMKTSGLIL